MVSSDEINKIGIVLNDPTRPLKERFRALFTLKNIGGDESVDWISKAFEDKSALLKHEVAYCLGQGHLQLSFFRYDWLKDAQLLFVAAKYYYLV